MRRSVKRSISPFAAGVIAIALIAVATFLGFTKRNPFADHTEIRAAFRTVNQLKPKSPVRIAGVNVGKVTKIEPLGDRGAVVTMQIDDAGLPIHKDATFKVRPRIFLEGNYFVDVHPGRPSSPVLTEDETVPVQQTAAPVSVTQVFEALQTDTREDLRKVLQNYGRAIDSDGGDGFNRAIRWWEPAFKNSARVNDATRGVLEHDLSNYLKGAERVARGLDRHPEQLKSLVTAFHQTADAFAREQSSLSAAIRQLPRTLAQGFRTFGVLNEAFPPLRRFVADMRPTVRSSRPALEAQLPFVRQMRGLLSRPELRGLARDLRPLVPELVELNKGGIAVQEQQRLLSSCQTEVIIPWQNQTVPDPNFKSAGTVPEEAAKDFVGLAGESRSFDANGQYVRSYAQNANYAYLLGDGRFYLTQNPVQGVNPPKYDPATPRSLPPLRADVPCETQEAPDLRTNPGAPPPGFRIDQNAPGAAERRAKANAAALDWMRDELVRSGWDEKVELSEKPLTAAELDDVRRTLGKEAVR